MRFDAPAQSPTMRAGIEAALSDNVHGRRLTLLLRKQRNDLLLIGREKQHWRQHFSWQTVEMNYISEYLIRHWLITFVCFGAVFLLK